MTSPTYLRNIEKGETEKKSWYQYIFLRYTWKSEGKEGSLKAVYRPGDRSFNANSFSWYKKSRSGHINVSYPLALCSLLTELVCLEMSAE